MLDGIPKVVSLLPAGQSARLANVTYAGSVIR